MTTSNVQPDHLEEHAHPGPRTYANIAAILTAITALEVAMFFFNSVGRGTLVVMLLVLMAVKFAIVVGYYMHLHFDHQFFMFIFSGGLMISITIIIALIAIFGIFSGGDEIIRSIPVAE